MAYHFKISDWSNEINIGDKKLPGIIVTFDSPLSEDLLIQVYEKVSENEYHLIMFSNNLSIATTTNEVIITNDKPFTGKIVIK